MLPQRNADDDIIDDDDDDDSDDDSDDGDNKHGTHHQPPMLHIYCYRMLHGLDRQLVPQQEPAKKKKPNPTRCDVRHNVVLVQR
jgi:hypothetical protein